MKAYFLFKQCTLLRGIRVLRASIKPASFIMCAFLLFLTMLAGCAKKPEYIIMIGIDTLGAEHLSCYGYPIATSPCIDAFAQNATLYEHSVAQSSWTLPSFASMFTSLYYHEHKSGLPCQQTNNVKKIFNVTIIDDSFTTLAEILSKHGYRTAAFTEGAFLSPAFGFSQGFDIFEICSANKDNIDKVTIEQTLNKDVKKVVDVSLEWIRKNRLQRFFLFLHTYEPHRPLKDPMNVLSQIEKEYSRSGFDKQVKNTVDESAFVTTEKKLDVYNWTVRERMLYDCEIKYTDHHIGRFFKELKKMGIFDKSLIILTSDHGEEFYEHGELYHGHNLYQTTIFVPLIVKKPNQTTGIRENRIIAEGVDIMPTILQMCKINTEGLKISGSSLFAKSPEKIARSHLFIDQKNLAVGIKKFQKAIFNYNTPQDFALLNLEKDPKEKKPVFQPLPDKTFFSKFISPDQMPQIINALCFDEFSQKKAEIDMLKALGYIN